MIPIRRRLPERQTAVHRSMMAYFAARWCPCAAVQACSGGVSCGLYLISPDTGKQATLECHQIGLPQPGLP
ncbi:hypothetical protein TRIATDRAFT_253690 [Trichoderma atroviride IMI 206040]|uniref:Uncharacterized protein n=1 Tax=Hypocrea atroviridis (strain ATCC 20476 / IMI 206040) TaxID=452589 RepID=G9PB88_HYPAI|nr:uncharacterized protein TRIATDRAFT_253690 [Trichoderma atroviride IMI 206040]EHK39637.1 hypothetical protein TRIATDRAFT_253690 [Trichoderma atroviride IMI 206040]